jgi:hypothetical protein
MTIRPIRPIRLKTHNHPATQRPPTRMSWDHGCRPMEPELVRPKK